MFKDREDDFTGIFPNVGKVIKFCDKKYNKGKEHNKGVFPVEEGRSQWKIINRNTGRLMGDATVIDLCPLIVEES
jgi:hypothetical protein